MVGDERADGDAGFVGIDCNIGAICHRAELRCHTTERWTTHDLKTPAVQVGPDVRQLGGRRGPSGDSGRCNASMLTGIGPRLDSQWFSVERMVTAGGIADGVEIKIAFYTEVFIADDPIGQR